MNERNPKRNNAEKTSLKPARQKRAIHAFINLKLMRDTNERWSCADTLTRS
jgi:hypothetical protein